MNLEVIQHLILLFLIYLIKKDIQERFIFKCKISPYVTFNELWGQTSYYRRFAYKMLWINQSFDKIRFEKNMISDEKWILKRESDLKWFSMTSEVTLN